MGSTEEKLENFDRVLRQKIERITSNEIVLEQLLNLFNDNDGKSGAIVSFIGTVRNHSTNGIVKGIYYEAYLGMAEEKIKDIEKIAKEKWKINKIKIIHRIGELKIGEKSIVIIVSAYHSKDAFEACKFILNRIKSVVPIWKRELLEDGNIKWMEGNTICSY
ncbi:MAG: molybdenum cofactor biosynthesis protein MoaE [Candidatus Nitrosocosmicus sp.]